MTIDEAINHAEEVAVEHTEYNRYGGFESCDECAKEHLQLAKWLKELKQLREQTTWIPVTEDAPPKGTICLWCNNQGGVFTSEITYRSECSNYVGKHGYFSNGLENYGNIVAWMPLPKSYKEVGGSENDI